MSKQRIEGTKFTKNNVIFISIFLIFILLPIRGFANIFPSPSKYGVMNCSAADYARSGRRSLDKNGVLVFDYGPAYRNLGKWHNPFFIARYAHALYNDWYKTNFSEESLRTAFLAQANFLLSSYKEGKKGMAYWVYPFENTYYGVGPGHISGIAQSQIAGVLLRAYYITGDKTFKNVAKKAMKVYLYPTSAGGVVTTKKNDLWIQEIASPNSKPFNILNGHITGLLGVLDIVELTSDKRYQDVAFRSIATVRKHLHEFDAGFSSFYSLDVKDGDSPKIANRGGYNAQHVWQLKKLFEITKDPVFSQMAALFKKYEERDDIRKAKGSTNPKTHGPAEAAGWFGNRYWSHNVFPTFYELHMKAEEKIDGIYIGARTPKSAPQSFSVSLFQKGRWIKIWNVEENVKENIFLSFSHPVSVSALRLDIQSDNGNKNVALDAFMPIRSLDNTSIANYEMPVVTLSTLSPGFRNREEFMQLHP